jgi:hypothetical protein
MKSILVIFLSILVAVVTISIVSYQQGYQAGIAVPRKPTFKERVFHDNSAWACKHTRTVGIKCYKYEGDTK